MKVLRPFINTCKWFLVKMSSNHKHSAPNGVVRSSYDQKQAKEPLHVRARDRKWRKAFLLFWPVVVFFMFIWALTSFNGEKFDRNVGTPLVSGEVSPFAHYRGFGYGTTRSSNIVCAVQMPSSENNMFELVTGQLCPSLEELSTSCILNATFLSVSSVRFCCEENILQTRELRSHATYHCKGNYIRLAEICLWVLIGMAISYNLCRLYHKLITGRTHMMKRQQPLSQEKQAHFSSGSTGKWREKLLVVFVLAGVIFSFWLFWFLNRDKR